MLLLYFFGHKRLYRFGYTAQIMSFYDIAESCSRDLFHSITKSGHCLHELLSCYAERPDSLRPRGHDYVLTVCSKQSFLVRSLFDCV